MKTARPPLRYRTACRGAVVLPLLLLTACAGTIHSRWARPSDSVDVWQPRMNALPIEIHGAVPGASPAATIAMVNHGTANSAAHDETHSLMSRQRIVLYMGGNTVPTDDTYCQATPRMRNVAISASKVLFASALCDGPRVVVTDRREVKSEQWDADVLNQAVKRTKALLMYGLSTSQAQVPAANQCTNDLAGKQC